MIGRIEKKKNNNNVVICPRKIYSDRRRWFRRTTRTCENNNTAWLRVAMGPAYGRCRLIEFTNRKRFPDVRTLCLEDCDDGTCQGRVSNNGWPLAAFPSSVFAPHSHRNIIARTKQSPPSHPPPPPQDAFLPTFGSQRKSPIVCRRHVRGVVGEGFRGVRPPPASFSKPNTRPSVLDRTVILSDFTEKKSKEVFTSIRFRRTRHDLRFIETRPRNNS